VEKEQDHVTQNTILHANEFLGYYGVPAQYLEIDHDPVESVLQSARDHDSCLIILGGYSTHTKTKSKTRVLDGVLDNSQQAIMIC
jgi:hypothetical protein